MNTKTKSMKTNKTTTDIKQYRKTWYAAHKAEHLRNVKAWQKRNREQYLKNSYKPLAKKFNAIKNNEYCYSIYAITTPEGIYIGCHGHMPEDITLKNYWGSGVKIKEVIKKVGKENCKKEILYTTHNINEAKQMESLFIQMSLKINNNILNCDTKSNYYYRQFNCEKVKENN